jgi:DNA polymerase III delta subunit
MQIIHGEHLVQSRDKLHQLTVQAKDAGHQIKTVLAKELSESFIEELFGSQSLFATPQTIIIEELHSLPKSKKKDSLITLINNLAVAMDTQLMDVILWEKRDLTATMLKKFTGSTVHHYKVSKQIFSLMEQLSPNQKKKPQLLEKLRAAIESESDFFVLTMMIRQIRLLIETKEGSKPAGPPFMVAKLQSQAKEFSLAKLLELHSQLTRIDYQLKQSANYLTLSQELDLLVLSM